MPSNLLNFVNLSSPFQKQLEILIKSNNAYKHIPTKIKDFLAYVKHFLPFDYFYWTHSLNLAVFSFVTVLLKPKIRFQEPAIAPTLYWLIRQVFFICFYILHKHTLRLTVFFAYSIPQPDFECSLSYKKRCLSLIFSQRDVHPAFSQRILRNNPEHF